MFRVAHISDLHVLDLAGVPFWRFLNKRITGYANLRLKRSHQHKPETLRAVCRRVKAYHPDHLVITGDITNLALETEFAAAKALLQEELGYDDRRVSMVPGNHDAYTKGAALEARIEHSFGAWMKSDVNGSNTFPFVHLRGPLAIVGLSSAIAQLPLLACGAVSSTQIDALRTLLNHQDLKGKTRVYLNHHPLFDLGKDQRSKGLKDLDVLRSVLQEGVYCHGHLHTRTARTVTLTRGSLASYGATSASMNHENRARVAGFNAYEFDDAGVLVRTFAQTGDGTEMPIAQASH
jgi:3',5'-cyclic AMP phosphodiesterase CpdA